MEPLLTVPQVAEMLGVRPKSIYCMVEEKRIPHIRLGGKRLLRFDRADLVAWLASQKSAPSTRRRSR